MVSIHSLPLFHTAYAADFLFSPGDIRLLCLLPRLRKAFPAAG